MKIPSTTLKLYFSNRIVIVSLCLFLVFTQIITSGFSTIKIFALNTTYYVDQATGNDSDDGLSEDNAFLTIQAAANIAEPGDTILIKNGTYREQVTINSSGTTGNLITYKNFPGHSPVVSASDLAAGWASLDSEEQGGTFVTGFEAGDFSEFNSTTVNGTNTIAVTSSVVNHGNYAVQTTFDGVSKVARASKEFTLNSDVYVRYYFRVNSSFDIVAANQRVDILNVLETSATTRGKVSLIKDSNGDLAITARTETPSVNTFYAGTFGEITRDTWHYLEFRYKGGDATTGGAELWLDGVSKASVYSLNTAGLGISRIEVGGRSSAQTQPTAGSEIYFDDLKVDTSPIGAFAAVGSSTIYSRPADWTVRQVFDNDVPMITVAAYEDIVDNSFFYDAAEEILYIQLTGGADPNSGHEVEVSHRTNAIQATDQSYLRFEGLTLEHNNTLSHGGFHFNNVDSSELVNNISHSNFGKGILLDSGSSNNLVSGNTIEDNLGQFGGGIRLESDSNNNIVENNEISGYVDLLQGGSGIQLRSADNNVLRNNNIHDVWDSAIYVTENTEIEDGSDNNLIYGNIITNAKESETLGHAGTGIHVGIESNDNTIFNNLVYNVQGYAIQVRHNGDGNKIYNNTIYNSGTGDHGDGIGLLLGSTPGATGVSNNSIRNNIIHTSNDACISIDAAAVTAGGNTSDYNLCYNPGGEYVGQYNGTSYETLEDYQIASGQDLNSIYADPAFLNLTLFTIDNTSPAFNAGTTLAEVTEDILEIVRPQGAEYDLGAYEVEVVATSSSSSSVESSVGSSSAESSSSEASSSSTSSITTTSVASSASTTGTSTSVTTSTTNATTQASQTTSVAGVSTTSSGGIGAAGSIGSSSTSSRSTSNSTFPVSFAVSSRNSVARLSSTSTSQESDNSSNSIITWPLILAVIAVGSFFAFLFRKKLTNYEKS